MAIKLEDERHHGYALPSVATFGQNVRRLMEARGLEPKDLLDALGVKQGTLSDWMRDRRGLPEGPTLLKFAKTLRCTVEELIDGVDPDYAAMLNEQAAARSEVEDEIVDVSGHTTDAIPVIAEGEASPQGGLFWDDAGKLLSDVEDRITRPYDVRDPHAYGLRVRGDSMMRFYKPGDLVVVSPSTRVADGDEVYVQLLTGERLIKVVRRMNDGYLLESYNQAYEPRFVPRDAIGAMHPIVWSKRKASGQRATLVRAIDIPSPKKKASRPESNEPIWVEPEEDRQE